MTHIALGGGRASSESQIIGLMRTERERNQVNLGSGITMKRLPGFQSVQAEFVQIGTPRGPRRLYSIFRNAEDSRALQSTLKMFNR